MQNKMKKSNVGIILLSSLSMAVLSACGGSDSKTPDPVVYPDPVVTPDPVDTAATFPTQIATPTVSVINESGSLIIAESGLSLYTFDNDSIDASTCIGTPEDTDTCAGKWPPLLAGDGAVATDLMTIITRDTGDTQWAYKGKPLYQWFEDTAQGDINGDGVGGVWHLSRPMPLTSAAINGVTTYIGNKTIASVTDSTGVLEAVRLNKEGFTLYTFDNDPIDDSACAGACINAWPPLLADEGSMAMAPLSLITATNGNVQWAYKGKPLYFFANDAAAGDVNGDEAGNVWHTATKKPAIQRTTDNGRSLSATGKVNVLMPVGESTTDFSVTEMDKDGFNLYIFDNDGLETSNCEENCLVSWPAFVPNDNEVAIGDYTIFERADGTKQWAYSGQPLYFFKNDEARGDINGDGAGGVWHLIEPRIITALQEETNTLGSTVTTTGSVYITARDPITDEFVKELADMSGFALYTFDNDTAGTSNCEAGCLDAWPALLASDADEATAPFSIITRSNDMKQWAINGQPLYFFASDETADDTTGENVGSVWHIARPAPVKVDDDVTHGLRLVAHGDVLDSQGKTGAELQGITLYTFDNDTANSGESTCFDSCATTWPPLYATSADQAYGEYSIIERNEDNTTTFQWAYKGLPLYFLASDSANGIGAIGGLYGGWPLARP
ncbi:MAG: putative lipoprotein with Yx(FWY)xxD motif [Colwellia sp.]|jgi:predicted lipoprotein with Yx(FWY)xxD motif